MSRPKRNPDKPIEPDEVIDPPALPMRSVNLRIERTRKYVQSVLDMPADEAFKLINDQVQTKLLLMGEQILKWLEILDAEPDYRKRLEASAHIQTMTNCIAQIAKARIDVMKASGIDMATMLPKNGVQESPEDEIKETSINDFMERYAATSKQLTPGNIPENTPKNA